jgi:hypothetical protein
MEKLPYLKKVQTEFVPALDTDGVVYDARKETKVFISGDEEFSFWFSHLTPFFKKAKCISDVKLLYWISLNIPYNGNRICLNKVFKNEIENKFCISQTSINRSISFLKSLNIIIPYPNAERSATYLVNPCFIWRGGKGKRQKQQEMILYMIEENNLPEKEKKTKADIKRYLEWQDYQRLPKSFNFSNITSAKLA